MPFNPTNVGQEQVTASGSTLGSATRSFQIPAGVVANDVAILSIATSNDVTTSITGWTEIANSPQTNGDAAGSAAAVRLAVFYRVVTSGDITAGQYNILLTDNPSTATSVAICDMEFFRDVDTSSPINASAGSVQSTAAAGVTFPAVTTTVANCKVLLIIATETDTSVANRLGSWSNGNLSGLTEICDMASNAQSGGGLAIAMGTKATAGSTGTTSALISSPDSEQAKITVALRGITNGKITAEPKALTLKVKAADLVWSAENVVNQLLEDFESSSASTPYNTWVSAGSLTRSRVTTNVTQGTYSWRLTSSSNALGYIITSNNYTTVYKDFSKARFFNIDLNVIANSRGNFQIYLYDNNNSEILLYTTTGTGQQNLTVNLIELINLNPSFNFDKANVEIRKPVAAGSGSSTIDIDNMYLTVVKNDPILETDNKALTVTSQATTLKRGYNMKADVTAYSATGRPTNFIWQHKMQVTAKAFTYTPQSVGLKTGHNLTASVKALTVTSINTGLKKGYKLYAAPSAINLTLINIEFGAPSTYTLDTDPTSFSLTTPTVGLRTDHHLNISSKALTSTAIAVGMVKAKTLPVDTKALITTTPSVNLKHASKIVATVTPYNLTMYGLPIRIEVPLHEFSFSAPSPALAKDVVIEVPLTEFNLTSGIDYYKVQIIQCTGEGAPASHIEDSKKLEADAYVELFEIVLSDRVTKIYLKMNKDMDYQGHSYEGTGIKIEGVASYADDEVSRPKLTIFNPDGVFSYPVDQGLMDNAKIIRTRVLKEHADADIPIYRRQQWYVKRVASLKKNYIALELRDMMDGQNFLTPGRMFIPPEFPVVNLI